MANLIKQAQGKLNKAGDAARDPADLSEGETEIRSVSDNAVTRESSSVSFSASENADANESGRDISTVSSTEFKPDGRSEFKPDGDPDGETDAPQVGNSDSDHEVIKASKRDDEKAVSPANRNSSKNNSKRANTKASKKAGKKRRVGRPTGPARTPLTVRVLTEIDEALTDAVEDTGMSPQRIADEAMSDWLRQRGYLSNNQ